MLFLLPLPLLLPCPRLLPSLPHPKPLCSAPSLRRQSYLQHLSWSSSFAYGLATASGRSPQYQAAAQQLTQQPVQQLAQQAAAEAAGLG